MFQIAFLSLKTILSLPWVVFMDDSATYLLGGIRCLGVLPAVSILITPHVQLVTRSWATCLCDAALGLLCSVLAGASSAKPFSPGMGLFALHTVNFSVTVGNLSEILGPCAVSFQLLVLSKGAIPLVLPANQFSLYPSPPPRPPPYCGVYIPISPRVHDFPLFGLRSPSLPSLWCSPSSRAMDSSLPPLFSHSDLLKDWDRDLPIFISWVPSTVPGL